MTERPSHRSKRSRRRSTPAAIAARAPTGRTPAAKQRLQSPPSAVRIGWWSWPLLALLVTLVYTPVLTADFVNWDDALNVYENPRVVEPNGIFRTWSTAENAEYLPLTYTSFWLEWRIAGEQAWLFHLDNVLLHAANAVLVGLLAGALALSPATSWLVAAVWALHPVQVASVAWVTERKNLLYVFFWLASLLLYLRSRSIAVPSADARAAAAQNAGGRVARAMFGLSIVLCALAVLSKRAAITLPAAIVLAEWTRGGRLDRRFWRSLLPYATVALAGGIAVVNRVPERVEAPPLAMRLAVACRALWFYVASFVWPRGLLPVYPRWPLAIGSVETLAAAGLAGAAALGIAVRRRIPRPVAFGLGLFLINAALVIGVVWFTFLRFALVSDHLAYLPSLGLAFAVVTGLHALARSAHLPARVPAIVVAVACAALGVATWRQAHVWHDSETLWTSTLARNPDCIPCHVNLAMLLVNRGELDAAIAHYEHAIRVEPEAKTMQRLGNTLMLQKRFEAAQKLYERSLRADPADADTHYNLGNALRGQGKTEEAIARYREGLRVNPRSADLHHNLGRALLDGGRRDEATQELEEALRLSPDDVDAAFNLAVVSGERGDRSRSIELYGRALRHETDDAKLAVVHFKLAQALMEAGRTAEAHPHLEAAHRLDPDDVSDLYVLATGLRDRGHMEAALRVLEDGLARSPDETALAGLLAWIRATSVDPQWRDGAQAVQVAERACALTDHEDGDLLDTLAAAYAEAGRFDDAVRTARQALAAADDDPELSEGVRGRLALYEAGKPYRQPRAERQGATERSDP